MNKRSTSKFASRLALIVSLFFISLKGQAQCPANNAGPYIMPMTTWQTVAQNSIQYCTFDATAGCQYTFSFCQQGGSWGGMYDPYLVITDLFNTFLADNDDWCGLGSELTWICPTSGTYRIHNLNLSCSSDPENRVLAYWSSCNPPACSGTPVAGTSTASLTTIACEGSADLGLSGNTFASSLEYQWEWSTNGTNWFALGGVQTNPMSNTGTITTTTMFRCSVTCTVSGLTAISTPVTVTVTGPVAGTSAATPPIVCNGGTSVIGLMGNTTSGVSYQWQSSTDNTIFNNISGETNPTYTTPPIISPMYYKAILTCTVNGLTSTATSASVDTLSSVAPPVSPASLTVACGSPAVMSATPVTGGTIAWYTQQVGGTQVAMGTTVSLYPSSNTTYWAENSLQTEVTSISTTGAVIIDHQNETGDDRGGIALSANYVYYSGDNNTGRFNKSDLTGGTSLTLRDGFFGDQSTNQLWQLGNAFTSGGSFSGFDNVDRLYALDENLIPTGVVVNLSQSIYLDYGSFVAPGQGYVLLYDGSSQTTYRVDINTGAVSTLGTNQLIFYWPENWAGYGWAEFDGTNYSIVFREDWPNDLNISKFNASTGVVTPLQTFTNLSDMAAIVYDGSFGRMYFHHEYGSQFGGTNETLGFLSVTTSPGCGNNDRSPVAVTVTPGPPPTISPTGTTNICIGQSQVYTASAGASFQWYLNGNPIAGATNQTYSANASGNYTCFVTTGIGCTGMSAASTLNVNAGVPPSVGVSPSPNDTICVGTIVNFTATPVNGGTNPSYQWQKNGLNVGINSNVYTGAGLINGDVITVIMTVGTNICTSTPTATSPAITMTVQTNTVPSVTISANPGTTACEDEPVVFTANPTNGGTTPTYQWTLNGGNVGTGGTYTATAGSLSTGDVIAVVMTPSLLCSSPSTAGANVNMTIDPLVTPTVSIAASSVNICQGDPVTFTATDNAPGGSYQWYVNGAPSGPNSATYTYMPGFNDVVTLDFTPPAAGCYDNITVSSNSIGPISVTPGLPTMATATASQTGVAAGTLVTVYANLFNFNTSYTIDWYINSAFYTTTTVPYMSYYKGVGQDVIYAICNNSGSGCYLAATTNNVIIDGWPTNVASTPAPASIEVYPNPFSKEIVVKGLADGDKVILFNMLGQTLQEWKIEKADVEQKININEMAAGSYLLNIRDKDGNFKDMKKLQKM